MAGKNNKTTATQLEKKVRAAIAELSKEGKRPTYANVRDEIGGGSFRDLGPIIKAILAEQEAQAKAESAVPEMPADVAELAAAIWEGAYRCADEIAGAYRRAHAEELKKLREEITEREGDVTEAEDALYDMTARAEAVEEIQSQLEKEIVELRVVVAGLEGRLLGREETVPDDGEEHKKSAAEADDTRQINLFGELVSQGELSATGFENEFDGEGADLNTNPASEAAHEEIFALLASHECAEAAIVDTGADAEAEKSSRRSRKKDDTETADLPVPGIATEPEPGPSE